MYKVMVLWSGGVESTSVLKYLLAETEAEVHAHYVKLDNPERRTHNEFTALANLCGVLRSQFRWFKLSQSTISVCDGQAIGRDYALLYPVGLVAMRHEGCTRLVRGWCEEDEWARAEGRTPVKPALSRFLTQRESVKGLLQGDENVVDTLPGILHRWPKARHWGYLGDLAELTWSCRRPKYGTACGRCHSCLERAAASVGSSAIREVAEGLGNVVES